MFATWKIQKIQKETVLDSNAEAPGRSLRELESGGRDSIACFLSELHLFISSANLTFDHTFYCTSEEIPASRGSERLVV